VLSNGIDANDRMIGFIYAGDPVEPDGAQVFLWFGTPTGRQEGGVDGGVDPWVVHTRRDNANRDGSGVIKRLAGDLRREFPDMKGPVPYQPAVHAGLRRGVAGPNFPPTRWGIALGAMSAHCWTRSRTLR